MGEGCPDCGCPLEVCCGTNRKKFVPVSELKRTRDKLDKESIRTPVRSMRDATLRTGRRLGRAEFLEELGLSETAFLTKKHKGKIKDFALPIRAKLESGVAKNEEKEKPVVVSPFLGYLKKKKAVGVHRK